MVKKTTILYPLLLLVSCGLGGVDELKSVSDVKPILDSCIPGIEICGDGIDQDCNGFDLSCSGEDSDRDGFLRSEDCNDHDRMVYPGISVSCQSECGGGTQLCRQDGTFSNCSCGELCEAGPGGSCYYVSPLNGSDSNPGTFSQPWKTAAPFSVAACKRFALFFSTCKGGDTTRSKVQLKEGDVVYFMSGEYTHSVRYGEHDAVAILANLAGAAQNKIQLKAYPGQKPVISPERRATGMIILNSQHLMIEGLTIRDAYQTGLWLAEASDSIELRNLTIFNTDGLDHNNLAGLKTNDSTSIRIHHNYFFDNFDRSCLDTDGKKTENSRNLLFFGGGMIRVDHNVIFQQPPITAQKTGACVGYKHPATVKDSFFQVDHNIFFNCFNAAVQSYTSNGIFQHNLIVDSENGFRIASSGHMTDLSNYLIANNTLIRTRALDYRPTAALDEGGKIGAIKVVRNISVFNGLQGKEIGGVVNIDPYGSESVYQRLKESGELQFEDNCYFHPQDKIGFGFFSMTYPRAGEMRGIYDLTAWQKLGFDRGSYETDPQLDFFFFPHADQCKEKGAF